MRKCNYCSSYPILRDAEEDKRLGDKRGDEMPAWVADKEKRLEKIRAARAALEAEAKAAAEAEMRRRAEAEEKRLAEGRKKNGRTRRRPVRSAMTRRSATSPIPPAASC